MRKLIEQLAKAEKNFVKTRFIAPRVRGSKVRVKFEGLINTYAATPDDFEGWGVFKAVDKERAEIVETAKPTHIDKYLKLLKPVRLILVRPVRGQTWLAYPANAGSFRDSFGKAEPVLVHLVNRARAFEEAVCRWDGANFWFEKQDRKSDPRIARRLAQALKAFVAPEALRIKGLKPELRVAYALVFKNPTELRVRCSEDRLRRALQKGGGRLESFVDCGDHWTTQWVTGTGERHTSAIQKSDLTVLSAGICLDGEDRLFDLTSLVGVVEGDV